MFLFLFLLNLNVSNYLTDPKPKVLILRNNISFETVTFDKNYTMFENGFGHVSFDNYWRGLKSLHKLTLKAFGVRFELTVSAAVA